jgi:hypothetical protein
MQAFVTVLIGMLALSACAPPPQANLGARLIGISKETFLRCSGPPQLSMTQGDREELRFLTNRSRGAGLVNPATLPVVSCSGNATFQNGSLTNVSFGGDQTVCTDVFAPCQAGTGR